MPKAIEFRDEHGNLIASTEPTPVKTDHERLQAAMSSGKLVPADEQERIKDELLLWARKEVARHLRFSRDWQAMERGQLDHWLLPELKRLHLLLPESDASSTREA